MQELARTQPRPSERIPDRLPPRVVIEGVHPEIDCGAFPIKRTVGEKVEVRADVLADGHDVLACVVRYRYAGEPWAELPMAELGNDRWAGQFSVDTLGRYEYTVEAWVDRFASWQRDVAKKAGAGQAVSSELVEGSQMVLEVAARATGPDALWLSARAARLREEGPEPPRVAAALDPELGGRMLRWADRSRALRYGRVLGVMVGPERGRFGAWYEMFPRSASPDPGRHGTLRDCEARLPYVSSMGFDVLYLPPVHPIGLSFRKGPNNRIEAGPGDVGCPWAIGAAEGGHRAVHPGLGTIEDFDRLVASARRHGIEIALDIAFQCSPDHPYVREHPQWFRNRPDGSIKYAENPPKKYQDIYPLDFDCADWRALWAELRDVILFWVGHAVRIFRVDNPHTKPFRFWEWLIRDVHDRHPDVILLSEAFTRPKVMRCLAKVGFTQSYTYFTWRTTKPELIEYFTELAGSDVAEYMRPNLFVNTPDIFHESLQQGGRPAFQSRLVLAATLGASYGVYGPPLELCETRAVTGTEEYQDSEKYQLRHWDLDRPGNIREFITRVNRIRRDNPALHSDRSLRFHPIDNDRMIFYSKSTPGLNNIILVVVNLNPHQPESGWVRVPLDQFGLAGQGAYQVHDLINDARYLWHGERNYVRLDPQICPAHIFRLRRKTKTERDFDYYA